MHVLIITPFFPPDSHVSCNRWERLSREFIRRGHNVSVVSICHHKEVFALNQLGKEINVKVCRVPVPVQDSLRYYTQLAVGLPIYTIPRRMLRLGYKPRRLLMNIKTDLTMPWTYPDCYISWVSSAFKQLLNKSYLHDVNIVVGSHPYAAMLKLANLVHRRHGIPWVADFRDPWCRDPQAYGWLKPTLLRFTERRLLASAKAVVTINRQLADMIETSHSVEIVPNCFGEDKTSTGSGAECRHGCIRLVYAGRILPISKARVFMRALMHLGKLDSSYIEIAYYGNDFGEIARYGKALSSKGIDLRNNGFVSQTEVEEICRNSDLLLLFGWCGPGKKCLYTGKIFDYLQSGRPVIAVGDSDTALGELINQTGAGVLLDNENEICNFFRELLSRGQSLVRELEARRNENIIARFSAKNCAEKYISIFKKILQEHS